MHDITDRYAAAFTRKIISTPWAAYASQQICPHQLLQGLLKITPRNTLTPGDIPALHRLAAGVMSDVNDRFNGEQHFF
jgi:hypothetical protein